MASIFCNRNNNKGEIYVSLDCSANIVVLTTGGTIATSGSGEGYGGGRVPLSIVELVEQAAKQKPVILTTRVRNHHIYDEYGFPGSYRYFMDRETPLIISHLGTVKGVILVKLCMGNGLNHAEMVQVFKY